MTSQRSGIGIGVSLDEIVQKMGESRYPKEHVGMMADGSCGNKNTHDVSFDDGISPLGGTNLYCRKRKMDFGMGSEEMMDFQGKRKFDVSMTLDEITQMSRTRKSEINVSLDEIANLPMSRMMKRDVGVCLEEVTAPVRRDVDSTTRTEGAQQRRVESSKKDSGRSKKSKWDRYNKDDTMEEEDEDDDVEELFIRAYTSSESSDDEEEPSPTEGGEGGIVSGRAFSD